MAKVKATKTKAERAKDHCSKQGKRMQRGTKGVKLASRKCQSKGPARH